MAPTEREATVTLLATQSPYCLLDKPPMLMVALPLISEALTL